MALLIGPLYALFILGTLFASFFIVFHFANYSVNRRVARFTILVFCLGTAVLLITNIALFFSIPFDSLGSFLPDTTPSSGSF